MNVLRNASPAPVCALKGEGTTLTIISTSLNTENAYDNLFIYYKYYNIHKTLLARTQLLLALGYRIVLNVEP